MWNVKNQPWCDLETLSIGREATRTAFYPFGSTETASAGDWRQSERVTLLSGAWRFRWLPSPLLVDDGVLVEPALEQNGYQDIAVPKSWQFAGFGQMLYTDEAYPFPVVPPYIPAENETGVYKRSLLLDITKDARLFLRFEGVESAFSLYLNDRFVGYSQGSRMPSEFEITAFACQGDNRLCVVVYQYCDGTYLEDQDMWWLGGIIRDVLLLERPKSYLADLLCDADFCPGTGEGTLCVVPRVAGDAEVRLSLFDPQGRCVQEHIAAPSGQRTLLAVAGALAWNAEQPHLYTLIASVWQAGRLIEATQQRIGFRRVEIVAGDLLLNGQRIMMRGVNRHEFHPQHGRAVSAEQTERELLLIKRNGMNAVRTAHYPNIPDFYDICDRLGLYVIDECDLETHGFEIEGDPTRLAEDPAWEAAYVERAERMVGRDRNHACVLLWSLGNESAYGRNFAAMYRFIKQQDPSRPVHYESDRHCVTTDVSSTMYTTVGMLHEKDLELSPKRPHILCEFAHAMGNGPGSLKEYIETCENSWRIQGYFLWEFKDHGVYHQREDGKIEYKFGGEFGEEYHTGNFCIDGMLFADGTPSPSLLEYRQLISPIQIKSFNRGSGSVVLQNRWDFQPLQEGVLGAELLRDGICVAQWEQTVPEVPAHGAAEIMLKHPCLAEGFDYALWTLNLVVMPGYACPTDDWVGRAQFVLKEYKATAQQMAGRVEVAWRSDRIHMTGNGFSMGISLIDGRIVDYVVGGVQRMDKGPQLNFLRAYIDNDRKLSPVWMREHLHSMRMIVQDVRVTQLATSTRVTLCGLYAPNAKNWRTKLNVTYDIDQKGHVLVRFCGAFEGDQGSQMPPELPKLGTKSQFPRDYSQATWSGRGPHECYCDSKASAQKGIFSMDVADLQVPYECPQDNGNRTEVDFVALTNAVGEGVAFCSLEPRDMSVRPQEDKDLLRAAHACDVPEREYFVMNFDARNSGLGSGSCGPNHLAQHAVPLQPFDFFFAIVPVSSAGQVTQARQGLDYLLGCREGGTCV